MKLTRAELLALAAAIANIGLWLQAGLMVEAANLPEWLAAPVEIFGGLVGVIASSALGVGMVGGIFEIAHHVGKLPPTITRKVAKKKRTTVNKRFWYLVAALGVIIVGEVYLLAVVLTAGARGLSLAEQAGGWLPFWAAVRVLAAALVLIGLSLVAKIAQPAATTAQPRAINKQPPAHTAKPAATAKQPITDELLRVAIQNNPGATQAQLGQMFDPPVSGAAVGKRIRAAKGKP